VKSTGKMSKKAAPADSWDEIGVEPKGKGGEDEGEGFLSGGN